MNHNIALLILFAHFAAIAFVLYQLRRKLKTIISIFTSIVLLMTTLQSASPVYATDAPELSFVTAGGYTLEISYTPTQHGYEDLYSPKANLLSLDEEFTVHVKVKDCTNADSAISIGLPVHTDHPLMHVTGFVSSATDGSEAFSIGDHGGIPVPDVSISALLPAEEMIGASFDLTVSAPPSVASDAFLWSDQMSGKITIGKCAINVLLLHSGISEDKIKKNCQLSTLAYLPASGEGLRGLTFLLSQFDPSSGQWNAITDLVFAEEDEYKGGLMPVNPDYLVEKTSYDGKKMFAVQLAPRTKYKIALKGTYPGIDLNTLPSCILVVSELGSKAIESDSHVSEYGSYLNFKVSGGAALRVVKTDQNGTPLQGVKFALLGVYNNRETLINTFVTDQAGTLVNGTGASSDAMEVWNPASRQFDLVQTQSILSLTKAYESYVLREIADDTFPYTKAAGFRPIEITISNIDYTGKGAVITPFPQSGNISIATTRLYYDPTHPGASGDTDAYFSLYNIAATNEISEVTSPATPEPPPSTPPAVTPATPTTPTGGTHGGDDTPDTPNPQTPVTPDNPGTPGDSVSPPAPQPPTTPTERLIPKDDGYEVIDDDGVPLGFWHQDPDGVWIFDEYVPMGNIPQTGNSDFFPYLLMFLGAAAVLSAVTVEEIKRLMRSNLT